jgi:ferredoxin-like protein FixX
VFSILDIGNAEFKIGEVDPVFEIAAADDEVAGLDVSVDDLVPVQVFDAIDEFQSDHQDCFECESSAASFAQSL